MISKLEKKKEEKKVKKKKGIGSIYEMYGVCLAKPEMANSVAENDQSEKKIIIIIILYIKTQ